MNLSKEYKKIIDDEFAFVIKRMAASNDPSEMMYFFSGLYAMIHRILNLEFSNELLFVHFIIEKSYKDIVERIDHIKRGQNIIKFNEDFGIKLLEYTIELKESFYNSKLRQNALEKIVVLAYTTCGNGFYLSEKGRISVFSDKKQID